MELTNSRFMDCLEKAKQKMKDIEEKNSKDFIYTQDLINRMALCIYDIVQQDVIKKGVL